MLIEQGALAFERWFGVTPDRGAMWRAVQGSTEDGSGGEARRDRSHARIFVPFSPLVSLLSLRRGASRELTPAQDVEKLRA